MELNISIFHLLLIISLSSIPLAIDWVNFEKINVNVLSSFSSGVGVSYVLVHLMPKIVHEQSVLKNYFKWTEGILYDYAVYILVWIGFVTAYALYKINENSLDEEKESIKEKLIIRFFWFEISFFALYNFMFGYIIVSQDFKNLYKSLIYFVAVGLHFVMSAWGLKHHYKDYYESKGKIILSVSIFLGSAIGMFSNLPIVVVSIGECILIGAMVLNSIRFELPIGIQSHIRAFFLGTTLSAILFVLI